MAPLEFLLLQRSHSTRGDAHGGSLPRAGTTWFHWWPPNFTRVSPPPSLASPLHTLAMLSLRSTRCGAPTLRRAHARARIASGTCCAPPLLPVTTSAVNPHGTCSFALPEVGDVPSRYAVSGRLSMRDCQLWSPPSCTPPRDLRALLMTFLCPFQPSPSPRGCSRFPPGKRVGIVYIPWFTRSPNELG